MKKFFKPSILIFVLLLFGCGGEKELVLEEGDLVGELLSSNSENELLLQLLAIYQCRSNLNFSPFDLKSEEEESAFLLAFWKHWNFLEIEVLREEAESFYNEQIKKFTHPASASTRHLFVAHDSKKVPKNKIKEKIFEIYEELKEGEPFGDLILKYSESLSVEQGGYLGLHIKGELLKEYEDLAFNLEEGEFGEPVSTEKGWHIIQLIEKTPDRKQPFEEVEEDISNYLYEKKYLDKVDGNLKKIPPFVLKENRTRKWKPDWKNDEILWKAGSQTYFVSDLKKDWSNFSAESLKDVRYFLNKQYEDGLLTEVGKLFLLDKVEEWEKEKTFLKTRDWCNSYLKFEFEKRVESQEEVRERFKAFFEENSFDLESPPLVEGEKIRIGTKVLSEGKFSPSKEEMVGLIEKLKEQPLEKVCPKMGIKSWFSKPFKEELVDFPLGGKTMLQTALDAEVLTHPIEEGSIFGPFFTPEGWVLIKIKEITPPQLYNWNRAMAEIFHPFWRPLRTEIYKEILEDKLTEVSFKT